MDARQRASRLRSTDALSEGSSPKVRASLECSQLSPRRQQAVVAASSSLAYAVVYAVSLHAEAAVAVKGKSCTYASKHGLPGLDRPLVKHRHTDGAWRVLYLMLRFNTSGGLRPFLNVTYILVLTEHFGAISLGVAGV